MGYHIRLKNPRPYYKYIVKGSPKIPFVTYSLIANPTVYIETFSVPILDPFPVWQLSVETTREPTHGATKPLPRMAMVAHSKGEEVCLLFLFIALVYPIYDKNDKNICFPLIF